MITTTRCSDDEKLLIETTAKKRGMNVSKFILMSLSKNLPLNNRPVFDRNIERKGNRLSFELNTDIDNKINTCKHILSTQFKTVYKWEIILFCALKECESICEFCGKNKKDVTRDVDPYAYELYGEKETYLICGDCSSHRSEEV